MHSHLFVPVSSSRCGGLGPCHVLILIFKLAVLTLVMAACRTTAVQLRLPSPLTTQPPSAPSLRRSASSSYSLAVGLASAEIHHRPRHHPQGPRPLPHPALGRHPHHHRPCLHHLALCCKRTIICIYRQYH